MAYVRKLIHIDEDLCDGCGQCVPGCEEGALRIIDGKARLVAEKYCDGLGACLGHCPTGALTVHEVPAEDFDPEAVTKLLSSQGRQAPDHMPSAEELRLRAVEPRVTTSCQAANKPVRQDSPASRLGHWPVQLRLVPPDASFLNGADLLLTADCVPVALPGFHQEWVGGRVVLLGCPKFDDGQAYVDKLTAMFRAGPPASITVLEMEVPCCSAYGRILTASMRAADVDIPSQRVIVGRDGSIKARKPLTAGLEALHA